MSALQATVRFAALTIALAVFIVLPHLAVAGIALAVGL